MHLALARPKWRIGWQPRSIAKRLFWKRANTQNLRGCTCKLHQVMADLYYVVLTVLSPWVGPF